MYPPSWNIHCISGLKNNKKRPFTKEEDNIILDYIATNGPRWKEISSLLNGRSVKQCRERYRTYLNPSLRNDPWTDEEDQKLIILYKKYGPKWVEISKHFRGRSDNMIKNRFNYHIIKRPRNFKMDQKKIMKLLNEHDMPNDIIIKNEQKITDNSFSIFEEFNMSDFLDETLFEL